MGVIGTSQSILTTCPYEIPMDVSICSFSELDKLTLYEILALRMEVFVVEQNCFYQDVDGKDIDAFHLICRDEGRMVGYLRILRPGATFEEASIGRVLVTERGKGIATEMIRRAMGFIRDVLHEDVIRIESQAYVCGLYEKLGFVKVGGEFLDAGIPHIQMVYRRSDEE